MMIMVNSDSRRLLTRAAIAASVVLGLGTAWAGQPPAPTGLEVGSFETEPWVTRSGMQISLETGFPLAMYDVDFRVGPGTPAEQAREYLRSAAPTLGLRRPDLDDLRHHATHSSVAGSTVRFRQMVNGVPVLGAEAFDRLLPDITETAGTYELRGPYAHILDWDSPYKGIFSQSSPTFDFTRQADAFEAVNGYYHIDTYMRYLNETLGVPVIPYQYSTGVVFDPSGWNGADNSSGSSAGTATTHSGRAGPRAGSTPTPGPPASSDRSTPTVRSGRGA
jgi:hypothetical protein